MSAFQRRLDILECIPSYPRKITAADIMNKLENANYHQLTIRKIQRDLEHIESMGLYGLEADKRSKPYGWSINLNWKKLNISLMDENTALAFSTLKQVASNLLPESTINDLDDYFIRADSILEKASSDLIRKWKSSVDIVNSSSPVSMPSVDENVLSSIKKALFHRKQINAELRRYLLSHQPPIWKYYTKINPLGLVQHELGLTLICSFGSYHEKTYKLPLGFIRNIEVLDQNSSTPKAFDFKKSAKERLKSNSTSEFLILKLKIRKDSYFILSDASLSEDQTIEDSDDPDFFILTSKVPNTPKLKAFLRGLGANVEVLAPDKLRSYFKELAHEYLAKYS